jgi:hypothetical protein
MHTTNTITSSPHTLPPPPYITPGYARAHAHPYQGPMWLPIEIRATLAVVSTDRSAHAWLEEGVAKCYVDQVSTHTNLFPG